jgi:hypothetical protein
LLNPVRELRTGRGFARAVHTDDGNDGHATRLFAQLAVVGGETLLNFAGGNFQEIQTAFAL